MTTTRGRPLRRVRPAPGAVQRWRIAAVIAVVMLGSLGALIVGAPDEGAADREQVTPRAR